MYLFLILIMAGISVVNFEDYPVIAKLILGGERQSVIAEKFGVGQGMVSQVWAGFRDRVYRLYAEERLLKREVAERGRPLPAPRVDPASALMFGGVSAKFLFEAFGHYMTDYILLFIRLNASIA